MVNWSGRGGGAGADGTGRYMASPGEDYIESRRGKVQKKERYVAEPAGERFTLGGPERAYLVASLASFSVAHGRATQGLHLWGGAERGFVEVCSLLSPVLLGAALLATGVAAVKAGEKGRSLGVWIPRALLGGPLSLPSLLGD